MKRFIAIIGLVLSAPPPATAGQLSYERAQAYCNIAKMQAEQPSFAMGSVGWVVASAIVDGIANEQRKQEFYKNCMILQGYSNHPANPVHLKGHGTGRNKFPPAPRTGN